MSFTERDSKRPDDVDRYVGSRIRLRRAELQISQHALADKLGIAFQQVQKYEVGRNRVSASRLFQIARTLDVPTTYFFDGFDRLPDTLGSTASEQRNCSLKQIVNDPSMLRLLRTLASIDHPAVMARAAVVVRTIAG